MYVCVCVHALVPHAQECLLKKHACKNLIALITSPIASEQFASEQFALAVDNKISD